MKKENRKIAQQRRAQERKKQEKIRKLKKFLAWFIPGIILLLLGGRCSKEFRFR